MCVRCRLIFMGYQRGACSCTSGVQNFEVVSRFLENLGTPRIYDKIEICAVTVVLMHMATA
jgi:hypothetical protein